MFAKLISGDASLVPNHAYRHEDGRKYRLKLTVQGYGLKANGLAYYLALTIFFLHLILVILHVWYTLGRSHTSTSWSSLTDMLLLSQTSHAPENVLKNTCAGADAYKTPALQMSIRGIENITTGHEMLQLLVDKDEGVQVEHRKVYGAKI